VAIVISVLALDIGGDALRDAFDFRLQRHRCATGRREGGR
jgi:ABC-type dipeptide/oligopeptide/nickel transport system permease subunit